MHSAAAIAGTRAADLCGCGLAPQALSQAARIIWKLPLRGVKITGMKVFGVSLTKDSDRPYVFVKLETNQGVVGWGEGTLEGKAGAVMACMKTSASSSSARIPCRSSITGNRCMSTAFTAQAR